MNLILQEGFRAFGIELTYEMEQKLDIFSNMLIETNKKINLTAITEKEEIYSKHFVDSMSCQSLIKEG